MNILEQIARILGEKLTKLHTKTEENKAAITQETLRAAKAEDFLLEKIETEETRATTAELGLSTKIDNEVTRATAAEKTISDTVSAMGTAYKKADSDLQAAINTEVTERKAADTALENKKVDKVEGKQLSTEDYTTTEKTKLTRLHTYVDSVDLDVLYNDTHNLYFSWTKKNPDDNSVSFRDRLIPVVTNTTTGLMSPSQKILLDNLSQGEYSLSILGTPSPTWQLNLGSGPLIKNSGGVFELRNSSDNAYADLTVNALTIKGNVTQEGGSFITEAETVSAKDNTILLNSGETGAGVTKGVAGVEIDRGTLPTYKFLFDESDDRFKVGSGDDLWSVMLRDNESDLSDGGILTWDSTTKRAKTAFNIDDLSTKYLPLTGGELTGGLILKNSSLNFSNSGGGIGSYLLYDSEGLLVSTAAVSDKITLYSQGGIFATRNGTDKYEVYDKGNLDISQFATTDKYLPLTGGDLTGHLGTPILHLSADNIESEKTYISITQKDSGGGTILKKFLEYKPSEQMFIIGQALGISVPMVSILHSKFYRFDPMHGKDKKYLVYDEGNLDITQFAKTNEYLPLSGGQMTGSLMLPETPKDSATPVGIRVREGLWDDDPMIFMYDSDQVQIGSTFGRLAAWGKGVTITSFGAEILFNTTSNIIHKSGRNSYTVYDSGNLDISKFAVAGDYIPLAGNSEDSLITGPLYLQDVFGNGIYGMNLTDADGVNRQSCILFDGGQFGASGDTPASSNSLISIGCDGQPYDINSVSQLTVGYEKNLPVLKYKVNSDDGTGSGKLKEYNIYHEGNLDISGLGGDYLPLTGGTLTGNLILPKNSNDSGVPKGILGEDGWLTEPQGELGNSIVSYAQDAIYFGNDKAGMVGIAGGTINIMSSIQTQVQSVGPISISSVGEMMVNSQGKLTLSGSDVVDYNNNKFWTAGNDGSGSGLDADLLDGKHASEFALKSDVGSSEYLITPNVASEDDAVPSVANRSSIYKVTSTTAGGGDGFIWANSWGDNYATQLYIDPDSDILAYRRRSSMGVWNDWISVASTNSLRSYLPLVAGEYEPLTGALYVYGAVGDGPGSHNTGIIVGNDTHMHNGVEIRANNIALGIGAHQDGNARFWIGEQGVSTKFYFMEVPKVGKNVNFLYRPTYNGANIATINEIPSLSGYAKSVTSGNKTFAANSSGIIDLNGEVYSATVSRTAKTFLAAPVGSAGVASFRAITTDDLPTIPYSKLSGTPTIPNSLPANGGNATSIGVDDTMKVYAQSGNEINFGGTSNASDIIFGYRARDSKPIPTSYQFGAGGSASVLAGVIYSKGIQVATLNDIPSLSGYATQSWVNGFGFATQSWVNGRGFLTSHQSLSGYATQSWVQSQGYLTSHQSLSGYATTSWVSSNYYPKGGMGFMTIDTSTGRPYLVNNQGIGFKKTDGSSIEGIYVSASNILVIGGTSGANLPIQIYNTVTCSNTVTSTMGFYDTSDRRLKENIKTIELKNEKINLYEFDKEGKHSYGVIAQEVEELYPTAVQEGSDGYKTVNYNEVLTLKCAELEAENKALKERLDKIEYLLKSQGLL